MGSLLRNHVQLHVIVFIWGFTGILGKLITIDAIPLVWWRMGIAVAGLLAYMLWRQKQLRLSLAGTLKTVSVGLLIATHWICFFHAIKVSTVSVALACMSSTALFVSFLEPLLYRRRIIPYEVLFGALVIVGLIIIFQFETEYAEGIGYAIAAAFLAGLFGTINGVLVKSYKSQAITLHELAGGFVAITVFFLVRGELTLETITLSSMDLMWLLLLGIVCTAWPFVVSVEVMKALSPFTVSITINLEPIYAILLALLIFGSSEHMSAGFYFGAVIIIATVAANAWLKYRLNKKQAARL